MSATLDEMRLMSAARAGNLQRVKDFLVRPGVDVHVENDRVFRYACENAHTDVAKYIVEWCDANGKGPVDLGAPGSDGLANSAFRQACKRGDTRTAQWICSATPTDLHTGNDEAFIETCFKAHTATARWIWELSARRHEPVSMTRVPMWIQIRQSVALHPAPLQQLHILESCLRDHNPAPETARWLAQCCGVPLSVPKAEWFLCPERLGLSATACVLIRRLFVRVLYACDTAPFGRAVRRELFFQSIIS